MAGFLLGSGAAGSRKRGGSSQGFALLTLFIMAYCSCFDATIIESTDPAGSEAIPTYPTKFATSSSTLPRQRPLLRQPQQHQTDVSPYYDSTSPWSDKDIADILFMRQRLCESVQFDEYGNVLKYEEIRRAHLGISISSLFASLSMHLSLQLDAP